LVDGWANLKTTAGTYQCYDTTDDHWAIGVPVVYNATSFRTVFQTNAGTTESFFGSGGSVCLLDTNDRSMGWQFSALLENWAY